MARSSPEARTGTAGKARSERKRAALGCRYLSKGFRFPEKATAPGSWRMPTRWRGCPPGTSGGNVPEEQREWGGGLSRDYRPTSGAVEDREG